MCIVLNGGRWVGLRAAEVQRRCHPPGTQAACSNCMCTPHELQVPAVPTKPYHIIIRPGTFLPNQGKQCRERASGSGWARAMQRTCSGSQGNPSDPLSYAAAVPSWLRNKRGSYANPIIVQGQGNPSSVLFRTYLNVENVK